MSLRRKIAMKKKYTKTKKPGRTQNLWKWFSRVRRLECVDGTSGKAKCMTCNRIDHPKNLQAGHVFPKGSVRYRSIKFDERNVYAQCGWCNLSMELPEFKERAEAHARAVYGDTEIDNMLFMARSGSSKLSSFQIEAWIVKLKQEVDELLKEKQIEKWW